MIKKIVLLSIIALVTTVNGCSNLLAEKDHCSMVNPVSHEDVEIHKNNCEMRKECKYIPPGSCYCPPGIKCICGGGEPPKCVPRETQS